MQKSNPLPPKLEAVMAHLLRKSSLNMTEAVKLPYLVNVIATRVLGAPISEGTYEAWGMGVVTKEVWYALDKCDPDTSPFVVEQVPFSMAKKISLKEGFQAAELSDDEGALVDRVYEEFSKLWATDLGLMTKLMNPSIENWGENDKIDAGSDAYDRLSPEYQFAAKIAASVTLDSLHRNSLPVESVQDLLA